MSISWSCWPFLSNRFYTHTEQDCEDSISNVKNLAAMPVLKNWPCWHPDRSCSVSANIHVADIFLALAHVVEFGNIVCGDDCPSFVCRSIMEQEWWLRWTTGRSRQSRPYQNRYFSSNSPRSTTFSARKLVLTKLNLISIAVSTSTQACLFQSRKSCNIELS